MKILELGNLLLKIARMQAELSWLKQQNSYLVTRVGHLEYEMHRRERAQQLSNQADSIPWD